VKNNLVLQNEEVVATLASSHVLPIDVCRTTTPEVNKTVKGKGGSRERKSSVFHDSAGQAVGYSPSDPELHQMD
jgi:hypothetical protein